VSRSELALALEHARRRTEALLEPLSDAQLTRQISPLQSPLVWDLAHIGHFEELWLLRRAGGRNAASSEYDDLYDAFAHARGERGRLPILPPEAARAYVREVRDAVLALLPELSLDDGDPLLERGFVVGMVVQHELQHAETMAQTLALAGLPGPAPQRPKEVEASGDVAVPGGSFTLGAGDAWAYDNERPAHAVELPPFRIDHALVTNAEYAAFVDAGGYRDRDAWSDEGWAWREKEGVAAPLHWELDGGRRLRRRFDVVEALPPREPVQHV
jgi:gamma-glutamyl hercynylcysteine S-oxide synthase